MVDAGAILKSLHPKLFRVICVIYCFQNCATKVKSHFEDVNQLIAKAQSATAKKKTRLAKFSTVGGPPQPFVIR